MNSADDVFKYIERQAQLDALRTASYVLFPYSEKNEVIPARVLEARLNELLKKVDNGERL
ncbi:hypothetical protein FACS18942_08110 [Planctomycetales bacterium]|nr:hypothetical protein FACS18942_08110 [Planctomycetales bacterium]GHT38270.1 hypothetical protein FACS189427_12240 [Planctomycetales bacterium]